jgi:hypothetical protein
MNPSSITAAVMSLFASILVLASQQVTPAPAPDMPAHPRQHERSPAAQSYVGDDACRQCHQQEFESFHRTAHYLTSRLPAKDSILGNFTPGANVLKTSNPDLFFQMDAKDGGFFQTAIWGAPPHETSRSERFGLVVGSGGKGQTYLYWNGDQLFQLPVSYWTELGWVNSPGYRDGVADFDRRIIPRCLECHATYFQSLPLPSNRYRKDNFVVGITCEKCHGSGQEHVQHQRSKSVLDPNSAILNPARFTRDRQMDLCAWCHAGHGTALLPAFSYLPGQPLEDYIEFPPANPPDQIDVHGSQVELLKKSRCYQSSGMTCLTCHDVHQSQHDLASFSERCLNCHKPESAMFPKSHQPTSNCIDCHMPKQKTAMIVFDWQGKKSTPAVRNHWISIYPH